ncbi:MAG TPA: hypothetical protein DIC64_02255 [Alphaproteobacteria bacterium]|nr:hypothetical protein [Alphaproteobacteria bacterium]
MTTKNFDTCASFYLENGAFMGRLVRLNEVVSTILKNHQYPLNVSAALAETTVLGALTSSMLKYTGLFTLQLQGNGPVSLLVTDVTASGKIRSCAKFDEQKLNEAKTLRKTEDIIEEVPHLVGGGYMALTVDEQNGLPPYQGVVDLKGKNLSELALRYFAQSEQIDTLLKLFVKTPVGESQSYMSAGIILQKVPLKGGKEIDLNEQTLKQTREDLSAFVQSLKPDEVFDVSLSNEEILHRLFHQNNLQLTGEKSFEFGCRCSHEKLKNTLSSFDAKELDEMADDSGKIEATCNFCGQKYTYLRTELKKQEKHLQ